MSIQNFFASICFFDKIKEMRRQLIMKQKVIFIDIDGTLVGMNNHQAYIPESAKQAIKKARANRHLVYLCTGRSLAEIDDEIIAIGFDGIIGAAGGYIETNQKVIFHRCLKKEELQEIEAYFKAHDIAYYFESNDGLYSSDSFKEFLKDTLYQGQIPEDSGFYALLKLLDECSYEGVNKLSFYSPNMPFETIVEHFEKQYDLVKSSWGEGVENTGELSLKGINKATAIKQLLAYLQIDLKDTYAIGDSMNDQEMFECVNTAIAMGNAMHGVKALADFITKDVLDDGLAYALDYFHLTD